MSGFEIVAGQMKVTNGSRVVSTTEGTLVNLLPAANDVSLSFNAVFPDVPKGELHTWYADTNDDPLTIGSYANREACSARITATPQEWSQMTILMAVPTGADIFVGRMKLVRSVAPSHAWGGRALDMLPKSNEWLPFSGSVLLEAEFDFARALSVFIESGNLVLHQQQSVGPAPGGYGIAIPASNARREYTKSKLIPGAVEGIPIYYPGNFSPWYITSTDYVSFSQFKQDHRHAVGSMGQATVPSPDPTNYGATYAVEVVGKFGRRS